MKKNDLCFIAILAAVLAPFFLSTTVYDSYTAFNAAHPYMMAFIKFGILATTGEAIGLRIKKGTYSEPGFGVLPRAIVWGFLGMWIAAAMKVFSSGVPVFAQGVGLENAVEAMKGGLTPTKVLTALMISTAMNTSFGPVFMTLHKITDTHILANRGSLCALVRPIPMAQTFASLNWDVQWNFVFKKTIPFFWIPAHTLTFLLPHHLQVLFAALLGVALGILLSIAAVSGRK